jgi:hypothetical protein
MLLSCSSRVLPLVNRAVRSWTLLVGAALLLGTIPGLVQVESAETDSSGGQTELAETLAVCVLGSPKQRVALQAEQKCFVPAGEFRALGPAFFMSPAVAGHRLSNGLLAPLRC